MLTKEECIKRLKEARSTIQPYYYINEAIDYAIKELQNPPLKFEELKENMWVWDNKTKSYIFIFKPLNWEPTKGIRYANMIINYSADGYYMDFEENRFYRREVNDYE